MFIKWFCYGCHTKFFFRWFKFIVVGIMKLFLIILQFALYTLQYFWFIQLLFLFFIKAAIALEYNLSNIFELLFILFLRLLKYALSDLIYFSELLIFHFALTFRFILFIWFVLFDSLVLLYEWRFSWIAIINILLSNSWNVNLNFRPFQKLFNLSLQLMRDIGRSLNAF